MHAPGHADAEPTPPLWAALFSGPSTTYIVPSDAGLNLLEDLSRRPVSLASYIDGGYSQLEVPSIDAHSADDLRTQHFRNLASNPRT